MPSIRPATREDAYHLAPRLRQADINECQALYGISPQHMLPWSVSASDVAVAMLDNEGECMGLAGVAPSGDGPLVGLIWMVSSEELLTHHKIELLRHSRAALDQFHRVYPALCNVVSPSNTVHRRLLRWLGFRAFEVEYLGPLQLPFIPFARMQSQCA